MYATGTAKEVAMTIEEVLNNGVGSCLAGAVEVECSKGWEYLVVEVV
jgi:hypothetical protein